MKEKKKNLWTKNFTLITFATILSAVGGEAMSLPISFLVFDETKSTLLSAFIFICSMLPDVILPILIAPVIDKGTKKKWLIGMDILLAVIYVVMGIYISNHAFNYGLYLGFTLLVATISVLYSLSYQALYPDLIPLGFEQKGFAVSSTIYPVVIITMAPIAAFLYESVEMSTIFYIVGALTVISVLLEWGIREKRKEHTERYTLRQYGRDLKEGFTYLKKEKGIRNIYTYMSITNGAGGGTAIVTQAHFQTSPLLSVTMLGFLKSAEMLGRAIGGLGQYKKEVPVEKRYGLTKLVYAAYNIMDAFLLFMPYPAMIANRFLCGLFGTTTATLRETAVQSYLPPEIRARIMAFFQVTISAGGIVFQLLAGWLGLFLPYPIVALIFGLFTSVVMIFLIFIPKESNRPVFEAVRK